MRQFALLGSVLVIGLIITWMATREAIRMAENEAEANFKGQAELYVDRIIGRIQGGLVAAQDLDNYYRAGDQVDAAVFERLVSADTHFNQNAHIVGVVWRVAHEDHVQFSEILKSVYGDDRGFGQRYAEDTDGVRFPFVFAWTGGGAGKSELLGRDITTHPPIAAFITQAAQLSEPSAVVMPPVPELMGDSKNYILAANPATSKTGVQFLIVQIIDFEALRSTTLSGENFDDSQFVLEMETQWSEGGLTQITFDGTDADIEGRGIERVFHFGAGQWLFSVFPTAGIIKVDYKAAVMTASVSLLLTGLFVFIFLSQSQRAERIAGIVKRRTRALKEAHEELEDHYRLLQKMNRDVEEARSAAELANRTKSEFLATMSHELRTPLNAILGFSQLLSEQALGEIHDKRYVDYAKDIHSSGSHLLSLINDILDLAKLEAGQVRIEKAPVYVRPLVEKVIAILSQQASEKGIELYAEFADSIPECLIGDELRLRQILINLCSNAIKFTSEGSVVARLHAKHFKNGQPAWILEVQDTGIGIPEDKQSTLFDRFTQVDTALSRRHGGVGLGLAICRELVDRMDGKISVRSIPTIGTTIRVHLPLEESSTLDLVEDDHLI